MKQVHKMGLVTAKKSKTWTPDRLRKLRERLGLSQRAAAERVGVSRRAWASWEGGEKRPSRPVQMLLDLLDV